MEDIGRFILEDVGKGDITSESLLGSERAKGRVFSRERCVLAGLREAEAVFRHLGLKTRGSSKEGTWIRAGTTVLSVEGRAVSMLKGERLALNFLMRMSGIATETRKLVDRCRKAGASVMIAGTRKTVPGFRKYDKAALAIGGGWPHRMGLYDGVLVKDNHLKFVSAAEAVRLTRKTGRAIEVEATSLKEAEEAARAGAAVVMLDNMSPAEAEGVAASLRRSYPRVKIEISGGITPRNILRYARFADVISLGYLTHSSRAANFSMDIEPVPGPLKKKRSRKA